MRKIQVQVKIGLLMLLAVVLLSAAGYLSYLNLSSIVASINVDVSLDNRLLQIREISMDLEKAENSLRIYNATGKTDDLQPFYAVISGIDDKVSGLREECAGDTVLLNQTDTISRLIEENIFIWNEILYLSQNTQVTDYLAHLAARLDSISAVDQKAEKGILKRVFNRSNEVRLDEQQVITDISLIEQQDQEVKEKLMRREAQLASTSSEIKERLYDLTAKMESEVAEIMKARAYEAELLATRTYQWLIVFTICGILLALLVIYIIARYVRKSDAFQVALEKSRDEAEKLSRLKEQFIANMSHEIRTPVTAITGFTEQLLQEPLDEKTARTLNVIKASSDHLAAIINDILDFSKLQDGKMTLEKVHFSIRQVMEEVFSMFEDQARRNNTLLSYSLDPETPPVLAGDVYRLKQIMINLLSNAVKFTLEGTVHFKVRCDRKDPEGIDLVMEFIDTGIGIDEDKLELVFEDFTQAEMSTTRSYGGTGLGLSIVRKLVSLHNGTIDIKSIKNQGTTITCILPYLTGDESMIERSPETPSGVPPAISRLKVLIVDDEEYNRMLFKTILDRWGIQSDEAADGAEALEKLRNGSFDLLFMDIRMPGIDGLQTTRLIRDELKISEAEMPVICISAASMNDDLPKYREAGMNGFLPKPFTGKMLLASILSVIAPDLSESAEHTDKETDHEYVHPGKIDLKNLYHISGGDEGFVKQMLVIFIDSTEKGLRDIQDALLNGNGQMASDLAHKLIPPCRHIGASDLCEMLKGIEKSSGSTYINPETSDLAGKAVREFAELSKLLNDHLAKMG
ncbi:response regulator [bacterium]|nr:response regulator [bacterium]